MDPATGALLVVVVLVAGVFAATNGALDAGDVIATPVATGALSAGSALLVAATLNLVGGLLGSRVAEVVGYDLVAPVAGEPGLVLVLAALLAALAWNALAWWRALPSSSTHALVGGLLGAGAVAGSAVDWHVLLTRVALPLLLAPLLGLVLAAGLAAALARLLRHAAPGRANRGLRYAQVLSSAGVAVGHGLQDAQKTTGAVLLALVAAGALPRGAGIPVWVVAGAAAALALGTLAGGWRVVRTLATRITRVDPPTGLAAEVTTAALVTVSAAGLGAAVSTTHTATAAITGAGLARGTAAVRWRVVRRVASGWLLTAPASAAAGAVLALALRAALA